MKIASGTNTRLDHKGTKMNASAAVSATRSQYEPAGQSSSSGFVVRQATRPRYPSPTSPKHGGAGALKELERKHGALPKTAEVLTGGGGRHLYFRHPMTGDVPNTAGKLAPEQTAQGTFGVDDTEAALASVREIPGKSWIDFSPWRGGGGSSR